MVTKNKNRFILLIIFGTLIFDQLTKYFTRSYNPHIGGFISLTFEKNTGSAFSFLSGQNLLLVFVSLIFIGVFLFLIDKIFLEKDYYAYFFILAGAIGNLIDRIFLGYVTDMINVGTFPVFNIADSAITIGAVIIIFNALKEEFFNKKKIKK
ncbi:signal peptidase II [Candidatus Woesearchaeota archaeon]|nr:MAG: signal peptidase II [Candidatus Woesearchaeota archaeon]